MGFQPKGLKTLLLAAVLTILPILPKAFERSISVQQVRFGLEVTDG